MAHGSPNPPHTPATGFLDLPAELRNWIYEIALAPTLQLASGPWNRFPPWSRFKVLPALALTGRQIGAEATSLFYKKLARHVRLYFDDMVKFHDFCTWAVRQEWEHVRRLQVVFRLDAQGSSMAHGSFWWESQHDYWSMSHQRASTSASDVMDLIRHQRGWNTAWTHPSTDLFRIPLPELMHGEVVDRLHTECVLEKGFHRSYVLPEAIGRHNSLVWPPLGGSLRLTTHVCMDEGCWQGNSDLWPTYHNAILELEGELRHIDFSKFPIAKRRAGLYHASRNFFDSYHILWGSDPYGPPDDDRRRVEIDTWTTDSCCPYEFESCPSCDEREDIEREEEEEEEEEDEEEGYDSSRSSRGDV